MKKESLNPEWKYWLEGKKAEAESIDLPHDAMIHRKRIPNLKNGSYTGFYPSGNYVYLKKIFGRPDYRGKKLLLEFEGVYMDSTVCLNGEVVGGHVYGYNHFYCDITGKLLEGVENELKVYVHSGQVPNARWYPGNGIYRPVWLWTGGEECIEPDHVYIRTISLDPPTVQITTQATCDCGCEVQVDICRGGKVEASGVGEDVRIVLRDAALWDAEHPNLYEARIRLIRDGRILDEVSEPFGVRLLQWNSAQGLLVNGKTVKLKGGCVHHDNGILGACDFADAERRKVRIMKESGFNAIRSAHYPISKYMLKACDELGMYIMDEAFDTWKDSNGMYGYPLYFEECWRDDIEKMVVKDRNHPSVVMYSIGNEISDTARPDGAQLAEEMTELCHELDISRPVCVCPNLFMNVMQLFGAKLSLGKGPQPKREDITDPMEEAEDNSELGGSAAINVLMATGPMLRKLMMQPKLSERGSGLTFSKVDICGYNYAEEVYETHHKMVPDRIIVGSETHPPTIKRNWSLIRKNPHVIGDFMWTAWDYLGEVGVGRIEYGENTGVYIKPYPSVSAYTGVIDLTGNRDLYSHLAAIVWGSEKHPYIAVQPLNHAGEKKHLSHYRFSDAVPDWTWPGYEGRKAMVEVYSRGKTVELLQNGKSLGRRRLKDCKALFRVNYMPGTLTAVAYNPRGERIAESSLSTAGQETLLSIEVENSAIRPDGESLAYIDVSLTDKNGLLKMKEKRTVSVEISGAGVLQAVGSASPVPTEPYDGTSFTTYQGRMQVIVRSGREEGTVRIALSAEGMERKIIQIEVKADMHRE